MKTETIISAFNYVADSYLDEACEILFPSNPRATARTARVRHTRRVVLLAAALSVLFALGAVAYASGWFPSVFGVMKDRSAGQAEFFTAAEQANAAPSPTAVTIPELDYSRVTIFESYYDGEGLALGLNIDDVVPDPVVGYEPDDEMIESIHHMWSLGTFAYIAVDSEHPTDDLDAMLARYEVIDDVRIGLSPEDYQEIMDARTPNAKAADLRNHSSIIMDFNLRGLLSDEDYERFWELLRANGHACVVVSKLYPGDHVTSSDGTDLGVTAWDDLSDELRLSQSGDFDGDLCLSILPLDPPFRGLDSISGNIKLYCSTQYWYMELNGPAYILYERGGDTLIPFTIENSNFAP